MAFVQIIDFRTSRIDEGLAHVAEWEQASEGRRTASRGMVCRDRDDSNHYVNIVFFDSYESAMENSDLPETQELARKLETLRDGPATFLNLDVVEERLSS